MKRKWLELNTSNMKFFKLDFDRFPLSIYSQLNTKVINNFKTRKSRLKKASIRKY